MGKFLLQKKINIQWEAKFAYAIGLIASDGHLHADGRHLGFVSKDEALVETFKKCLSLSNKISRTGRGGEKEKNYFTIVFGDRTFYRFLNEIGLENAKSKTLAKVDIPDEYFSDFVRGVFDGDGTFYSYWDTRWSNSLVYQLSFASASPEFIRWLKNKLTMLYSVRGFICKGDGVLTIRYVKRDTKKLFSTMYYQKNLPHLKRKYIKMKKVFEFDEELKSKRNKKAAVA